MPDQAARDLAVPDLYEADFVLWSERQAALLRRLQAGDPVGDQLDWDNLVEEVESLGSSARLATESLLARGLEHLLKIRGWPNGPVDHWAAEANTFLRDAGRAWAPSMARAIDAATLYREELEKIGLRKIDGTPPQPLPAACPVTLAELIFPRGVPCDVPALLAKLA
jgi:hypothetical protein